jgi:hypothetical protein
MLLLAMTLIFRSQSDQAIARAQLLKNQSLSLAESAGVTYQQFLIQYPDLATYNNVQWSSFADSIESDCGLASIYNAQDIQSIKDYANLGTTWQAIDPQDLSKGQYRLVGYDYTPDVGSLAQQPPGIATLRVQGRARAKGVASEAFGFGRSRSQVKIQFRVDPKPPQEMPVGLVGNGFSATTNASGSPAISANVCDLGSAKSAKSLTAYMKKLANGKPSKIAFSNGFTTVPPTEGATPLTGVGVQDLGNLTLGVDQVCQLPMLGAATTTDGLPQNCPTVLNETAYKDPQGNQVYKYNLASLVLGSSATGSSLPSSASNASSSACTNSNDCSALPPVVKTVTGNTRLVLGRTGNEVIHLYVGGNTTLNQSRISVTPGTIVYLYLHGSFDATDSPAAGFLENTQDPVNLQVYVWGSSGTTNFNLNAGHSTSQAFIFAPQASVSLINGKLDGAVWANNISIVGDASVTQSVSDPGLLKIGVPGRKRLNPAFSWQQEEAS